MATHNKILEETRLHEMLASEEAHSEEHHHVTPFWTMFWVFVLLLGLTVFTVYTAKYVYLPGHGNLILALVIASVKAILVAAFFMHLKYDKGMNSVVVFVTVFALVLFLGLTLIDLKSRALVTRVEAGEIVEGGDKHYIRNSEGKLERTTSGLGVTAKAKQDGHADHANPDGHSADPAHSAPAPH